MLLRPNARPYISPLWDHKNKESQAEKKFVTSLTRQNDTQENETQKYIFLSADGNFEVSLATKATLYHTGLVEVICQNI